MHIRELFPDVISEDLDYEYKTLLILTNLLNGLKQLLDMQTEKVE